MAVATTDPQRKPKFDFSNDPPPMADPYAVQSEVQTDESIPPASQGSSFLDNITKSSFWRVLAKQPVINPVASAVDAIGETVNPRNPSASVFTVPLAVGQTASLPLTVLSGAAKQLGLGKAVAPVENAMQGILGAVGQHSDEGLQNIATILKGVDGLKKDAETFDKARQLNQMVAQFAFAGGIGEGVAPLMKLVKGDVPDVESPATKTSESATHLVDQPIISEDRMAKAVDGPVNPNVREKLHDAITINPVPKLSRSGSGDAAVSHASARIAVPHMVDDLLAQVFPSTYRDPEAMSRTIDILNKDNILSGYEDFLVKANEFAAKGDIEAAQKWRDAAKAIAEKHDIPSYDKEVKASMKDPEISGNISRWRSSVNPVLDQFFNEIKGVDPNMEREGRGKYYDARINLFTKASEEQWAKFHSDDAAPMPEAGASSYRNPNAKHDPFDRAAKFTGDYSTNARTILSGVLNHRYNEVTKLRFYKDLVKSGSAVISNKPVEEIKGQPAKRLAIKIPNTDETGRTNQVERSMYVRGDLVREIRQVLGTDMPMSGNVVVKTLTQVQLAQIADAVTHAKNIQTVVSRAQGAGAWADVVRKVPGLGSLDALKRIYEVHDEIVKDSPAIRSEIAEMAQNGLIRPEYPSTGLQKITRGQKTLHDIDTASRIVMNRFFDNLAERKLVDPSIENRRNFINQIGQYNDRLMGDWMAKAKRSGVSPFVVAGRNFNRQGRWALTGNPGVEASSLGSAAYLRGVNLLHTGLMFTVPMMLNVLTTGKPGGREGTPLGMWDLGSDEEGGKHKVIDLLQWTGIRRGLRGTGLESLIEGERAGKTMNQMAGDAVKDVAQTALHPWVGPAPAFAVKAATGMQPDLRGKMDAQRVKEGGGKQYIENFRAALESQNPLVYAMIRPMFQSWGLDTLKQNAYVMGIGSAFLKSPAGAVGIRDAYPPTSGAEQAILNVMHSKAQFYPTPDSKEKRQTIESVVDKLKRGESIPEEQARAMQRLGIKQQDWRERLVYSRAQSMFKKLEFDDMLDVFGEVSDKDKQELYPILLQGAKRMKKRKTPEQVERLSKIEEAMQ